LNILALETSCDDTCAAVVKDGHKILSSVISSQTAFHEKYGGVVPEIASRKHFELIDSVIEDALTQAGTTLKEIDLFAATAYHGLSGSLLVGLMAGKTLAWIHQKPFLPINHIEGHIYANFIDHPDLTLPHICLTVSGGHTLLVLVKNHQEYELLGKTVDDAAGEAFDKIAQFLDIGFPGGPVIDRLATRGNPQAFHLPRPMLKKETYNFSFSGLKTAMLNLIRDLKQRSDFFCIEDVCASFQAALVEVLVKKTIQAAQQYGISTITTSGGVAANSLLRKNLGQECERLNIQYYTPALKYCMDNAAMIGTLAYYRYRHGDSSNLKANAVANILLNEPNQPLFATIKG